MRESKQSVEPSADRGREPEMSGGGWIATAAMPVLIVASVISKMWDAVTRDGTVPAFFRQGADELGAALKAFPDSIQSPEAGTIWSPTQGEIAAERNPGRHTSSYQSYSHSGSPPHPWPSEIARENRLNPRDDHGHDQSQDFGHSL
jgi:hypothetical protein